jgi:WD repeat-containing protein 61
MAFAQRAVLQDAHEEGVWSVAWSSSGQLVTGGDDETVRSFMLDATASGPSIERQHEWRGHELGITSVSVSGEAGLAASSSLDAHVRVWNLQTGKDHLDIDAGPIEAWTVALAPDGRAIASGSQSGCVNLWGTSSGQRLATISTGAGFLMSVAFSPNGRHVACGSADTGAVHLIDVEGAKVLARLEGHTASVRALAFSADGSHLLSGSDDGTVSVFDVPSASRVAALQGCACVARACCISHLAPLLTKMPHGRAVAGIRRGCSASHFHPTPTCSPPALPTVRCAFGTSQLDRCGRAHTHPSRVLKCLIQALRQALCRHAEPLHRPSSISDPPPLPYFL